MNLLVTINDLPDDQSGHEMDGIKDVLCRCNFHPYKTLAAHNDIVGLAIWNGARAERKAKCGCLKLNCGHAYDENARPVNGWRKITTFRLYRQPIGRVEIGYVSDRWDNSDDAVEAALEGLFLNNWSVGNTGNAVDDAFVRMHGWKRFLPGWCKHDNPVAAALQAAFWIRRCDRLRFVAVKPGEDVRDVPLNNSKEILAELAALHPDRKILQRKALSLRYITSDDIAAAYLVLQHATVASLRAIMAKSRWNDDAFIGDRTILGLMLEDGRSARDIAAEVGMSASMVSRRLKAAVEAITESLGPVAGPSLGSHLGKFVPRVERLWPEKRTDKPQLWTGPPRPRLETGYKLRDVAMPMAFERPGITDPGREKQWGGGGLGRRVKLPPLDALWAIAGYLAKSKIKRLPSGCAEDYPPETPRRFDWVIKASVDVNDDVIDGDMATSNSAGLFVPHWYNTRPRAAVWRRTAHKLPAELKKPALEQESFIASLLAEGIPSPYAPTSPVERRFATPYLNRLQDFWPREAKDGSTAYGDVTVLWPGGRTEPTSEKRRRLAKKRPKPKQRDAVDRINDLYVSE